MALGLCPGVDWSEKAGGTNGIGTCLIEKSPLTVHREQHFYKRDIDISCAVAPIFDHSGLLAGALDITLYGMAATDIFRILLSQRYPRLLGRLK